MSNEKFTPADILKEQISDAIYSTRHFLTDKATELAEVVIEGAPMVAAAPDMYAAMQGFVTDFVNDYVMPDGSIVDNPRQILVVNYKMFKSILAAARGESHQNE